MDTSLKCNRFAIALSTLVLAACQSMPASDGVEGRRASIWGATVHISAPNKMESIGSNCVARRKET